MHITIFVTGREAAFELSLPEPGISKEELVDLIGNTRDNHMVYLDGDDTAFLIRKSEIQSVILK
jgi:hypothetical protein